MLSFQIVISENASLSLSLSFLLVRGVSTQELKCTGEKKQELELTFDLFPRGRQNSL